MQPDVRAIAQGMQMAKSQRVVKHEGDSERTPPIDLEEVAQVLEEQNKRNRGRKTFGSESVSMPSSTVTVYVDGGDFYDLHGAKFEVVDVVNIRNNMKFEIGDKFVWDKHLVKGLGEMSNIDKIGETEEIYDVNDDMINNYDKGKFTRSFNPLTYKKGVGDTNSDN